MEGNHIFSPDTGRNFSLIGLSNTIMVPFFLSDINLYSFLPLIPQYTELATYLPRSKEQVESQSTTPSHFTFYCKISNIILD